MKPITFLLFIFLFLACAQTQAQQASRKEEFTHADTLRGSITPERAWWDVTYYNIHITPDYAHKSIRGFNEISFKVLAPGRVMQIDLQEPLNIQEILWKNMPLKFSRDGNAFYAYFPAPLPVGSTQRVKVTYEGLPVIAKNPPWDGGWIFTKDKKNRPWMSVACQGKGASVWYPCKDHQSDEPDRGASLSVTVPDTLVAVANGRLQKKEQHSDQTVTYTWAVVNPINNYDIVPYIGKYVSWHKDFPGIKGKLDCDFWVLDYDVDKAMEQFTQADSMLRCFEYWFGPYPFYEDGYKLVEAPHLGMEHQSDIAYGNGFQDGYRGRDLSESGWGLKWDFIIVHESAHEWFGNNITTNDLADMWVHEGFANYAETLFTTCRFGVEAGDEYCIGTRKKILNNRPIIAAYNVNQEGSGDMYYKGGNMIHMIRQIIDNDEKFREILRGINLTFYHRTVTSSQIEDYISRQAKIDFSKVFDQYLRTTQIPVLDYRLTGDSLAYRWINCVPGFNMAVKVHLNGSTWLYPTQTWKRLKLDRSSAGETIAVDKNFYVGLQPEP
jgi:aminopeptidase N